MHFRAQELCESRGGRPTIGHTKETKNREEKWEEKKPKTYKVEHKTKSPAQKEAKASELHPRRLELEICPSRLPCGHPYKQNKGINSALMTNDITRTVSFEAHMRYFSPGIYKKYRTGYNPPRSQS